MRDETVKLVESTPFMAGMTALGGFCNAYTCITRGGVFANAHTANMAKLGISLATLDWSGAFGAIVPILGCLLGSVFCELVKDKSGASPRWLGGHWHRKAMLMELAALFIVGFIPTTTPHMVVNAFMSFVTGFQLNMFRNWTGGGHNTTICTGNLRTMGQPPRRLVFLASHLQYDPGPLRLHALALNHHFRHHGRHRHRHGQAERGQLHQQSLISSGGNLLWIRSSSAGTT